MSTFKYVGEQASLFSYVVLSSKQYVMVMETLTKEDKNRIAGKIRVLEVSQIQKAQYTPDQLWKILTRNGCNVGVARMM